LWRFDPSSNLWFYINGNTTINDPGIISPYGDGHPGARYASSSIILPNDSMMIFGGNGYGNYSYGFLNDLWRYDTLLNQWYFINGSESINIGVFSNQTGYPNARSFRNFRCIDSNCFIDCICNDTNTCEGDNLICMNDILINNHTITILNSTFFKGNITIQGSNLILPVELIIDSFINITDSNILFNSSAIISENCITLSNINITVDLSQESNTNTLLLLNSTAGCLNISSYTIIYLNRPKCKNTVSKVNSYSLYIAFATVPNCLESEQQNIQEWIIALIIIVSAIVGLALIFVILSLVIPSLRRKIYPHQEKTKIRKKINKIKEVEEKVQDLK